MAGYVFISYSRDDSRYVRRLVEHLKAAGVACWVDDRIDYGDQWEREIQAQIRGCSALVVVMSASAGKSVWVVREVALAQSLNKPIRPLLLEEDQVLFRVFDIHYEDVHLGSMPTPRFVAGLKELLADAPAPRPTQQAVAAPTVSVARPPVVTAPAAKPAQQPAAPILSAAPAAVALPATVAPPVAWPAVDVGPRTRYSRPSGSFPDNSLTDDEHVVLHLHPHWSAMIIPTFWTVLAAVAVGAALLLGWSRLPLVVVGAIALALYLWQGFWPFVVWRSTHFVFTNERVLLREGVFNREQRDIPLARVNDVSSAQKLWQRILGCGQLIVESAGERGQSILYNIPKVVTVQKVAYELVEADHERRTIDDYDLRAALRDVTRYEPGSR